MWYIFLLVVFQVYYQSIKSWLPFLDVSGEGQGPEPGSDIRGKTVSLRAKSSAMGTGGVWSSGDCQPYTVTSCTGGRRKVCSRPLSTPSQAGGTHERHTSCGGKRYPVVSADQNYVEAASAGVRQADDLLSAFHTHAVRHSGHSRHFNPSGHPEYRISAG